MQSPRTVRVFAPAKINLTLHVTGRRKDGYHLLDSLVAFAAIGDWLVIEPSDVLKMRVGGPMAEKVPPGDDNLVFRAAALLAEGKGAAITLNKYLPVAAGIGGGSADAGAAMRGLWKMWGLPGPTPQQAEGIVRLGADVPVCVMSAPARVRGIGDRVARVDGLPPAYVVLVNPGVAVPTAEVFRTLKRRENPPMPEVLPKFRTTADLAAFLREQRNDLEPHVAQAVPPVAKALAALRLSRGALLTRMSGSGATCFALFAQEDEAKAAAELLRRPDWWIGGGRLFPDEAPAAPEEVS